MSLLKCLGRLWAVNSIVALHLARCGLAATANGATAEPIDRQALVARHNVMLTAADALAPLSVGNGKFAFTVDITGLQTFPAQYRDGIQLGTQSDWGWDSAPNPDHFVIEDTLTAYDAHGRSVLYQDGQGRVKNSGDRDRAKRANAWLRENPHRVQLGRLGLVLRKRDGSSAGLSDLAKIQQTLALWEGRIDSRFEFDGQPVHVETVCHPELDLVSVRIESPLVKEQRIGTELKFEEKPKLSMTTRGCDIERTLQTSKYFAALTWSNAVTVQTNRDGLTVLGAGAEVLELTLSFAPQRFASTTLPTFAVTRQAAAAHWRKFWTTGGAVDLSGSKDSRWQELERRIVLSQYLTAIQCAGSMPPQETGLVQNSWFGKFHLEMHWWHAAHFALWSRPELLERSLGWYQKIIPAARALAQRNGYDGARWPKMTGPAGEDSPSPIGPFLIWQQPHPIYFAELLYRAKPEASTLKRYADMVAVTAQFMASYAQWDEAAQAFVLGPPLIPAQESYGSMRERVTNPTYELAYWYWGIEMAQQWRERAGLQREPKWDLVGSRLAKPCVRKDRYEAIAVEPFTVTHDHPSLLQAFGFLPATPLIDPKVMERTFDYVLKDWDWKSTWGWDYPVLAMTAARLGRSEDAVNALLMDTAKNRYLPNGHVYQRANLPLYLPANGGLLAAVAMMAAGWDGAPAGKHAPGFPDNGSWRVNWENLRKAP